MAPENRIDEDRVNEVHQSLTNALCVLNEFYGDAEEDSVQETLVIDELYRVLRELETDYYGLIENPQSVTDDDEYEHYKALR